MSIFKPTSESLGRLQITRTATESPETRPTTEVLRNQRGKEIRMGKLGGKVAVITGGNSGIGLATARKFAEHGATVVISGRNQQTLDKAANDIGGHTVAIRADVAEAVLCLASADSAYVLGVELTVDGGMSQL